MKQAVSILLVLMLGLYFIPPHQPHTCFTHDGARFHGDCHVNNINPEISSESEQQIRKSEYICFDLIKGDGNFLIRFKTVVNNPIIPLSGLGISTTLGNIQSPAFFKLPEARCNTGPPSAANLLRGPPLFFVAAYVA